MNYGSNTHSQRFWRPTRVPKISSVILWAQVGSTQASLPKGRRSAALQHASSGACRKTFHLLQSTLSGRPRRLALLLWTLEGRRCSNCGRAAQRREEWCRGLPVAHFRTAKWDTLEYTPLGHLMTLDNALAEEALLTADITTYHVCTRPKLAL